MTVPGLSPVQENSVVSPGPGGEEIQGPSRDYPIVCFTSGKGGSGKTTLAVNFANTVAKAGNKVLLIDCDVSNQGTTGAFSRWIVGAPPHVTFDQLLEAEKEVSGQVLLSVKPGFHLIPVSPRFKGTSPANHGKDLDTLTLRLRSTIDVLVRKHGIDCVILDSFCGIDLVTTLSASVSDHVIIINEPDTITFTGALNLLNHLNRSFEALTRRPKIHCVINRMKPNFRVKDLTRLYKDNLVSDISEAIICYFPYNGRIFQNFGINPFPSDLLPSSLFVKKLKLLAYFLFKGEYDRLIAPDARSWSIRKVKSLYLASVDNTSLDSEYLVVKFSEMPFVLSLWFVAMALLIYSFPVTPPFAWSAAHFVWATGCGIFSFYFLYGFWIATRIYFNLAVFDFHSLKNDRGEGEKLKRIIRYFYLAKKFFSTGVLSVTLAFFAVMTMFIAWAMVLQDVLAPPLARMGGSPAPKFEQRMFNYLFDYEQFRELDLSGRVYSQIDFTRMGNFHANKKVSLSEHIRRVNTRDTEFRSCTFRGDIFQDAVWRHAVFIDGNIPGPGEPLAVEGSVLEGVVLRDTRNNGCYRFSNDTLVKVALGLNGISLAVFENNFIDGLAITQKPGHVGFLALDSVSRSHYGEVAPQAGLAEIGFEDTSSVAVLINNIHDEKDKLSMQADKISGWIVDPATFLDPCINLVEYYALAHLYAGRSGPYLDTARSYLKRYSEYLKGVDSVGLSDAIGDVKPFYEAFDTMWVVLLNVISGENPKETSKLFKTWARWSRNQKQFEDPWDWTHMDAFLNSAKAADSAFAAKNGEMLRRIEIVMMEPTSNGQLDSLADIISGKRPVLETKASKHLKRFKELDRGGGGA